MPTEFGCTPLHRQQGVTHLAAYCSNWCTISGSRVTAVNMPTFLCVSFPKQMAVLPGFWVGPAMSFDTKLQNKVNVLYRCVLLDICCATAMYVLVVVGHSTAGHIDRC